MQLVYSKLTCIVYEEEMQIKLLFVMENFLLTSVHVQCNICLGKRDHKTDMYHEGDRCMSAVNRGISENHGYHPRQSIRAVNILHHSRTSKTTTVLSSWYQDVPLSFFWFISLSKFLYLFYKLLNSKRQRLTCQFDLYFNSTSHVKNNIFTFLKKGNSLWTFELLTDFHEIWYERYAIRCNPNVIFIYYS
jgi:hypothetical protein